MGIFSSTEVDIMQAIESKKYDKAIKLINEKEFDPNKYVKNSKGEKTTLLCEASRKANTQVLLDLIKKGADVNLANLSNGKTPLHHSTSFTVNTYNLLVYGANENAKDFKSQTPSDINWYWKNYWEGKGNYDYARSSKTHYFLLLYFDLFRSLKEDYVRFLDGKKELHKNILSELDTLVKKDDNIFSTESFPKLVSIVKRVKVLWDYDEFHRLHTKKVDFELDFEKGFGEQVRWYFNGIQEDCLDYSTTLHDGAVGKLYGIEDTNEYRFQLAQLYFNENEYEKSIEQFVSIDDDVETNNLLYHDWNIKGLIADCYFNLGDYENAYKFQKENIDGFASSDEVSDSDIDQNTYDDIMEVFDKANKWEEGIKWTQSINNDKLNKEKYFIKFNMELENWDQLGTYYEAKGDKKNAIEYFELAQNNEKLILYSKDEGDYKALAILLEKEGDIENAAINYFKAELYKDSQRLWLKLAKPDGFFKSLKYTNALNDISQLNVFSLSDIINFGLKYELVEIVAEIVVLEYYNTLDNSHIELIQPLYTALLNIKEKSTKVSNIIFLLSIKYGLTDQTLLIIDDIFNNLYSELLNISLSDDNSKKHIEKLLQLNGYRISHDKENIDLIKIQEKLFDEFRLLSFDNFKGFENVLKYKIAYISFQQNWELFSSHLSLINTDYPQISKFGSLFKILVENLLNESKDKLESLNQYWRHAKKEFKQVEINSVENIGNLTYQFEELQPEYLIYNYWNSFFFSKKQSSEVFNSVYSKIIEVINNATESKTDENIAILIREFVDFYNNYKDQFKSIIDNESQINILSRVCSLVEEFDVKLHTSIIDILEQDYNYEYGI